MTVQELMDQLASIPDKTRTVTFIAPGFDSLQVWPVGNAWEYNLRGNALVLLDKERLSLGGIT